MTGTKAHDLYVEANKLLEKLKKYNRISRLVIPTDGRYWVNAYSCDDSELFDKVYTRLSKEQKGKLEELLSKFVTITKFGLENKLKFKIDHVEEENWKGENYKDCQFIIRFNDNVDGTSSLFVPTYEYAVYKVGKEHIIYNSPAGKHDYLGCSSGHGALKIEDDRVVSAWGGYESQPYPLSDSPAWIALFTPPTHLKNNNFYVRSQNREEAEEGIEKFKKKLTEEFITSGQSPIQNEIQNLLRMGFWVVIKERECLDKEKQTKEIMNLKGKEI